MPWPVGLPCIWQLPVKGHWQIGCVNASRPAAVLFSRVHMLGFVDSVEALLQDADLYLSTSSSSEGFPLAPSEALACGVPILVPGHAVFREAFGTCPVARMVDGLVAANWATAVTQVLDMPVAWRRQQARDFAETWLTLERMQQRLASFYQRWL